MTSNSTWQPGPHVVGDLERLFWSCWGGNGAPPETEGRGVVCCRTARCSETTCLGNVPFLPTFSSEPHWCPSVLGEHCIPTNMATCPDTCHLSPLC